MGRALTQASLRVHQAKLTKLKMRPPQQTNTIHYLLFQFTCVLLLCALVNTATGALRIKRGLNNLEGIDELRLVMNFVQYLRDNRVKDRNSGEPLANKYFVDADTGVSYSGGLSHENAEYDDQSDFHKLRAFVQKSPQNNLIDANKLRHDPTNTNNDFSYIWRTIADDMMLAIDCKHLPDELAADEFRREFIAKILNPWRDVLYDRYNSMLSADRQDAKHHAVLNAHKDSYVLVRERLIEKLAESVPQYDDNLKVHYAHRVPELTQWDVWGRILLDYIRFEFSGLKRYRRLREKCLNELSQDELEVIIDVLPQKVDHGFYDRQYAKFEVDKRARAVWLDAEGREIDPQYLVKLDQEVDSSSGLIALDESGQDLTGDANTPKRRRWIWRTIYRAIKTLSVHVINEIGPGRSKAINQEVLNLVFAMLNDFKEAVVQRANAINGLMDNEISREMLDDFYSHRDNLNQVFDCLGDELPAEKQPIYEQLMVGLKLTRSTVSSTEEEHIGRFRLQVDRQSLWLGARQRFLAAMKQLASTSPTLVEASENLAKALDEAMLAGDDVDDHVGDDNHRNKLEQAFDGLKQPLGEYLNFARWTKVFADETSDDADRIKESFMAKYRHYEPEAARRFQATLERCRPDKIGKEIKKELKSKTNKLREAIRELGEFKTYLAAYVIRTCNERCLDLMESVLKGAREAFGQKEEIVVADDGDRKLVSILPVGDLESERIIKRVRMSIEGRGRSQCLRSSRHRYSVSSSPSRSTERFSERTKLHRSSSSITDSSSDSHHSESSGYETDDGDGPNKADMDSLHKDDTRSTSDEEPNNTIAGNSQGSLTNNKQARITTS